jgi:hypothetical protein
MPEQSASPEASSIKAASAGASQRDESDFVVSTTALGATQGSEGDSVSRENASYRRRSMEQRRNIEIAVFGALVTAQIALITLDASNSGKATSHVISQFVAIVGITLFVTYASMILALEIRNRADRWSYEHWELNRTDPESIWETFRRSWAAWPTVGAAVITAATVWAAIGLSIGPTR